MRDFKRAAFMDGWYDQRPGYRSQAAVALVLETIEDVQGHPMTCYERLVYRVYYSYGWFLAQQQRKEQTR